MPKAVRMADIAEKVGVSTVTVSKALADKEGVSEEIRTKIKETASQMGYRQSGSVHRGGRNGTGNIGVLIPSCFVDNGTNSFYWGMYEKIVSRLLSSDYYGILELLQPEAEQSLIMPRVLQDNKIDGLIVLGQLNSAYRDMLQTKITVPTVFLDTYDSRGNGFSVISDGYYGMYIVTSYVLSLGHRDVHFVGTVNSTSSISDRYFGYCRAMSEYGLTVTPNMVLPDRECGGGEIVLNLPQNLPDAYVCNCDLTAYELINKLKQRGLKVPDDVSVAGFDNYSIPGLGAPLLTTYAVDMAGMARAGAEALLHQINHKKRCAGMKIVSGRLVVRASVRKSLRLEE